LRAVVFCPSNPFISVEPILALPGVRAALSACRAPVVAVSPVIGGRAVKGPTAKMMAELGIATTAAARCERYRGLAVGYVIDAADAAMADAISCDVTVAPTLMTSLDDRIRLAEVVLAAADRLRA